MSFTDQLDQITKAVYGDLSYDAKAMKELDAAIEAIEEEEIEKVKEFKEHLMALSDDEDEGEGKSASGSDGDSSSEESEGEEAEEKRKNLSKTEKLLAELEDTTSNCVPLLGSDEEEETPGGIQRILQDMDESESESEAEEDNSLEGHEIQNVGKAPQRRSDWHKRVSTAVRTPPPKHQLPAYMDQKLFVNLDTLNQAHLIANSSRLPSTYKPSDTAYQSSRYGENEPVVYGPDISPFSEPPSTTNQKVLDLQVYLNMKHPLYESRRKCKDQGYGFPLPQGNNFSEQIAIKGLPVVSPLYKYHLKLMRNNYLKPDQGLFYQLPVWQVAECHLTKLGINKNNAFYFMEHLAMIKQEFQDIFFKTMENCLPEFKSGRGALIGRDSFLNLMKEFESNPICVENMKYQREKELDILRMKNNERGRSFNPNNYTPMPVNENTYFSGKPELVRYIFCAEVSELTRFYESKVVLNMTPGQLLAIYDKIMTDPYDLFFFRKTPYVYQFIHDINKDKNLLISSEELASAPKDYEDQSELEKEEFIQDIKYNMDIVKSKAMILQESKLIYILYLPELTDKHMKLLTKKPNAQQQMCINLYHAAKRDYKIDKNSYISSVQLKIKVGMIPGNEKHTELFDTCIRELTHTELYNDPDSAHNWTQKTHGTYKPTLLNVIGTNVYTRESHLDTMSIVECFGVVIDRFVLSLENTVTDQGGRSGAMDESAPCHSSRNPSTMPVVPQAVMTIAPDEPGENSCSEQKLTHHLVQNAPIVLIEGSAGSGKTSALKKIIKSFPKGSVFACALQGRNIAALSSVLGGFCFTVHYLIHIAKRCCVTEKYNFDKEGGCYGADLYGDPTMRNAKEKARQVEYWKSKMALEGINTLKEISGIFYKRCPLEGVQVMVFDELGLLDDKLLAILLAHIARCSPCTKIVFCGDGHQLKSLGAGDVLKSVKAFTDHIGTTVNYTHCHRDKSNQSVIFNNCDAIKKKRPEDIKFVPNVFIHKDCDIAYSSYENYFHGRFIKEVIKEHDIDEYHHQVITYANVVRRSINPVLDLYFRLKDEDPERARILDDKSVNEGRYKYYVNRKIMHAGNNYEPGRMLINNEPLKLMCIVDCIQKKTVKKDTIPKDAFVTDSVAELEDLEDLNLQEANSSLVTIPEAEVQVNCTSDPYSFPKNCLRKLGVVSLENNSDSKGEIKYINWDKETRKKIVKHYCVTVYGSQGGEFGTIIGYMPYKSERWTNSVVYTLCSRGIDKVILAGDWSLWVDAINRDDVERNTQFGELAIDFCGWQLGGSLERWKKPDVCTEMAQIEELIGSGDFWDVIEIENERRDIKNGHKEEKILDLGSLEVEKCWEMIILELLKSDITVLQRVITLGHVCKSFYKITRSEQFWFGVYKILHNKSLPNRFMMTPEEFILACNRYKGEVFTLFLQNMGEVIYLCYSKRRGSLDYERNEMHIDGYYSLVTKGYILQVLANSVTQTGTPRTSDQIAIVNPSASRSFICGYHFPLMPTVNFKCKVSWVLETTEKAKKLREYTDGTRKMSDFIFNGYQPLSARIEETRDPKKPTINIKLGFLSKMQEKCTTELRAKQIEQEGKLKRKLEETEKEAAIKKRKLSDKKYAIIPDNIGFIDF